MLIYDVGAHTGEDTEFYLGKGFDVVAVEANPYLVLQLKERFKSELIEGRLIIVNKAIVEEPSESVFLYVNHEKTSWSSIYEEISKKNTFKVERVSVEAVNLENLFLQYGVPYFMKVDIELADIQVARSLTKEKQKPKYVSFEIHEIEILSLLNLSGYAKYQIRNQMLNGLLQKPNPTKEGLDFWPEAMDGYHSGVFGKDLPEQDWLDYTSLLEKYISYKKVAELTEMSHSWFDIHATLE
jgi:FkbM family methyltransferase